MKFVDRDKQRAEMIKHFEKLGVKLIPRDEYIREAVKRDVFSFGGGKLPSVIEDKNREKKKPSLARRILKYFLRS